MAGNGGNGLPFDLNGSQGTAGSMPGFPSTAPSPLPNSMGSAGPSPAPAAPARKLVESSYYLKMWADLLNDAKMLFPTRLVELEQVHQNMYNIAKVYDYNMERLNEFIHMVVPQLRVGAGVDDNDPNLQRLALKLRKWVAHISGARSASPAAALQANMAGAQQTMQQQQHLLQQQQQFMAMQHQQQHQQPLAQPLSQPPSQPADPPASGKPPRAPKAGAKRAAGEADPADGAAPKAKRAKAPAAGGRRKKSVAGGDSDGPGTSAAADADDGEKLTLGGEVIDLAAETDAAVDAVERVRARQLPAGPAGARAWDEGFQFLSAWRLTNEALAQRREKMPGAAGSSPEEAAEFVNPAVLRALQLGFAAHSAEVLRRAADAAKHRAASFAAPRRPEFATSGADARRGLGEIRRAAEKAAADRAERERQELMRAAASKRADEETRAAAQRAKAEMVGQMQANAANKALAATLGGRDAKWSKWGGGSSATGDEGKGKGKGKGKAGGAGAGGAAGTESGAEGDEAGKGGLAASRSRADLGAAAAGGSAPGGTGADGSADVQLQDLVVALQQDPLYCKSTLLYRMMNGMV